SDWRVHVVRWSTLHDGGTEGSHHARIARFLRENAVDVVVAEHLGAGMQRMLATMGIRLVTGASGDARQAVLTASG
ncbi:MAG: NifB/NifX family molybdenum-iron cluster-binding protein, partial [Mycobacteriales bacterium]